MNDSGTPELAVYADQPYPFPTRGIERRAPMAHGLLHHSQINLTGQPPADQPHVVLSIVDYRKEKGTRIGFEYRLVDPTSVPADIDQISPEAEINRVTRLRVLVERGAGEASTQTTIIGNPELYQRNRYQGLPDNELADHLSDMERMQQRMLELPVYVDLPSRTGMVTTEFQDDMRTLLPEVANRYTPPSLEIQDQFYVDFLQSLPGGELLLPHLGRLDPSSETERAQIHQILSLMAGMAAQDPRGGEEAKQLADAATAFANHYGMTSTPITDILHRLYTNSQL